MKKCSRCGETISSLDFYKNRHSLDKRDTVCKKCLAEMVSKDSSLGDYLVERYIETYSCAC